MCQWSIYKEKYEMRFTIYVYGIARDIRHWDRKAHTYTHKGSAYKVLIWQYSQKMPEKWGRGKSVGVDFIMGGYSEGEEDKETW